MDTKQRTEEEPQALTASAAPFTTASTIRLASGRTIRVEHGPDFGTLIRNSPSE